MPTVAETGYPGFRLENDFYLMAQGQTPDPIVAILVEAVHGVLASPSLREKFAKQDVRVVASTPEFATRRIAEDTAVWADVIRQTGLKAQ